jgi:hypothetical protein
VLTTTRHARAKRAGARRRSGGAQAHALTQTLARAAAQPALRPPPPCAARRRAGWTRCRGVAHSREQRRHRPSCVAVQAR